MKYIYSVLILLFFFGCQTNKINSIPKEIKNKNFYQALEQATIIAKSNHLNVENIGIIFTEDNLYIYISETKEINLNSDYKYLQTKINGIIYKLIVNQDDKIVEGFVDINKAIKVPFEETDIFEDEIKGYKIRFQRDLESNQFILQRLSHYYEYDKDFILEEDKKYFPNIKIILPEPINEPQTESE
ncbi:MULTISPECIES: hypothetical protein [unclassified Empedobacter]|uniref:hypothetical protein n=1 Tax=unclassified Empedobacter TaxID=2643773 RepID=UPI0024476699|nr:MULTISPECIES: hypothetical protein [unclassified Empedobacter]MDH0658990.1 hypothetical protein [Empedobacter sp. GD03865]MDH0675386.1 hypothetical protein [Empedobacter sp. GD03861]MDH1602703.1 hypothetical protein [Empedobacter sp. GD03739]MDH2205415.1 hypothetical protein [Empedobacter sp. GD03644]